MLLCSCTTTKPDSEIEDIDELTPEVKKYACRHSFGEGGSFYVYTVDYTGDRVIFTEDHSWNLKGWTYQKKKYKKLMTKEAKKLNEIDGVSVTYTINSKKKEYSSQLTFDMSIFAADEYFKKASFYKNPYIQDYFDAWIASNDPDYHRYHLKGIFDSDLNIVCE